MGFIIRQLKCFVYREMWDSTSIPPHHRLMNGVMGSVEGSSIKVPQEWRCSWGAPSFRLVVVLGSIGFLGMKNGSDGNP